MGLLIKGDFFMRRVLSAVAVADKIPSLSAASEKAPHMADYRF